MTITKGAPQVSHDATKFGGHRYCHIGDIMLLVCHVILQDHMIEGLSNFMGKTPSR